jgi:hypothetical protein
MVVLLKFVEEALDLDVLGGSLERLHLHKLLDSVFHVEGLDPLLEVVGLYLSKV